MRWKLVCCGSRDEAHRAFQNALRNGDDGIVVLLVDAEGPVEAQPRAHLHARDGWDLTDIDGQSVHLMVQMMEAWIVADADALRSYYGSASTRARYRERMILERVGKPTLENSLQRATERTQKGRYKKIAHASDLLKRIDAEQVKARCRHCGRLFDELGRMIDAADGGTEHGPRTLRTMTGSPASLVPGRILHYTALQDEQGPRLQLAVAGDLKEALGEAARDEKVSVADLLERIAGDWLARRSSTRDEGRFNAGSTPRRPRAWGAFAVATRPRPGSPGPGAVHIGAQTCGLTDSSTRARCWRCWTRTIGGTPVAPRHSLACGCHSPRPRPCSPSSSICSATVRRHCRCLALPAFWRGHGAPDWRRRSPALDALMKRYADRPMDFADATLVHLAKRESIATVFTIDHDDFETYRAGRRRFRVEPGRWHR